MMFLITLKVHELLMRFESCLEKPETRNFRGEQRKATGRDMKGKSLSTISLL